MERECQILNGARNLAEKKGLPSSQVSCPVEPSCEGEYCIFIPESVVERISNLEAEIKIPTRDAVLRGA